MELTKLYEVQAGLKKHIGYKGKDKFPKMMLAMLVEFMECANDWQGFKYWKKNNAPKTETRVYADERKLSYTVVGNPLLEEYVDGLHFVLETGLDLNEMGLIKELPTKAQASRNVFDFNVVSQYKQLVWVVLQIDKFSEKKDELSVKGYYNQLVEEYLLLCELLGFTEEQIEQAYFEKNEVNHQRQDNGY